MAGIGRTARRTIGLAFALGVLLPPAGAQADPPVPPAGLVAQINEYRAARGMPAVVLDERLAASCLAHVDYMLANGGAAKLEDSHTEIPGRPGYSDAGREAAGAAIIGYSLLNGGKPFDRAPGHLYYFLDPRIIRVGPAERTDTVDGQPLTQSCMRSESTDAAGARRPAASPPRLWSFPQAGATGAAQYMNAAEYPAIPAYEVGFVKTLNTPYLAGEHIMLWHDDVDGRPLNEACGGAVLGPGGRAVNAPTNGHLLVPEFPFLPGATYTTIATMSTARPCGDLQRTGAFSFTTAPRLADSDLIRSGEPFAKDGKVVAESELAPALQLVRGEMEGKYLPGGYSFRLDGIWEYNGTWQLDNMNVGETFQATYTTRRVGLGPTCYGRMRIVASWTKNAASYTRNPTTVEHLGDPECDAPPAPGAPAPSAGGPGTVVRIPGTALATATQVTVGGVPATAWTADDGGLAVTVPTGAKSGPLMVTSPTGSATAPGTFTVTEDRAAPDTRIDLAPAAQTTASTASIAFAATEAGSTFTCVTDGGAGKPCTSPVRLEGLAPGGHSFAVCATDPAGNADLTPAVASWSPGPGAAAAPGNCTAPGGGGAGPGGGAAGGGTSGGAKKPAAASVPVLKVAKAVLRRKSGALSFGTLTLPQAAKVKLEGYITVGRRRTVLKATTVTVAGNRAKTLKVTLPRAVRPRFAKVRQVSVHLSLRIAPTKKGSKITRLTRSFKVRVGA